MVMTAVNEDIFVGGKQLYSRIKSIIDDILIWSSSVWCILIYFECVCRVFQKYRVSLRWDKCHFLLNRVEYVGHDLKVGGNCPAKSKFSMITNWTLSRYGSSLNSFVSLVILYHHYAPYLEICIKPLQLLLKTYFWMVIPMIAWSPLLIQLFEVIKIYIASLPVLVRYEPNKPTFVTTDWSAEGMGWIMMQPADDVESLKATKLLLKTGKFLFDLICNGARLHPTGFGSKCCLE